MKLILLPGNNGTDNKGWIDNAVRVLGSEIDEIITIEYSHWDSSPQKILDLDEELEKLAKIINQIGKPYVIFAKTAGVLVTLKGIYEGKIDPHKCIFLGVPVIWGRINDFSIDDWFFNYEHPTLFIQKSGDPDFYHDELRKYINDKRLTNYKILEMRGDDKRYDEIEEIKDIIVKYFLEDKNVV